MYTNVFELEQRMLADVTDRRTAGQHERDARAMRAQRQSHAAQRPRSAGRRMLAWLAR